MYIQEQDLFHGAAITQIIEYVDRSVSIQKIKNENGYYIINNQIHILMKYRSNRRSPWRFGLSPNEYKIIRTIFDTDNVFFLVLICGGETICILNKLELGCIIDIQGPDEQWLNVTAKHGSSLWVSGSLDSLEYSIRHNDFPRKLFLQDKDGTNYEEIS